MTKKQRARVVEYLIGLEKERRADAAIAARELATAIHVGAEYDEIERLLLEASMAVGEARGHGNAAADFELGEDESTVT